MPIPSVLEMRVHANDARPARRWLTGWRLAVLAAVAVAAASGLALAWIWMDDGLFIVSAVIAGAVAAAGLAWFVFNDLGSAKIAPEPAGTSAWETRIRPHVPRAERTGIDGSRRNEGGEA